MFLFIFNPRLEGEEGVELALAEVVRVDSSLKVRAPVGSLPDLGDGHAGLVVRLQGLDWSGAGGGHHRHNRLPGSRPPLHSLLGEDLTVWRTGHLQGYKGEVRGEILHY